MNMKKLTLLMLSIASFVIQLEAFEDDSINAQHLQKIWYKNIPQKGRYYKFDLNGVHFKGTRDWEERWDLIRNATSFDNKRVLELGCNIGICSTFISKYLPVTAVTAIDFDRTLTQLGKQIQDVFEVEYPVYTFNLDRDPYEKVVGYNYDIVFCMSLYHWVKNKKRLLNFLSHFPKVIYEGHDSLEIEVGRLKKAGFEHYKLLGWGKGKRPVLLFSKEPIE